MVATKDVHFCSELVKTAGVIGEKSSYFVPKDQVTETHSYPSPSNDLDPKLVPGVANARL